MMKRKEVSFDDVVKRLQRFREERGWVELEPSDLAKSIVLEAAELLEHFQWDSTSLKKNGVVDYKDKKELASEVADVFIYILQFCDDVGIDLLVATDEKMTHNEKKYPTEKMKSGGKKAYYAAKRQYRKKGE